MSDTPLEPQSADRTAEDPAASDPAPSDPIANAPAHHGPSGDWASRPDADAHPEGVAVDSAHWVPGHEGDRPTGAISSADWVGGHEGAVESHWSEGAAAEPDGDPSDDPVDDFATHAGTTTTLHAESASPGAETPSGAENVAPATDTARDDTEPSL